MNEMGRTLAAEVERLGGTVVRFEHGGKHPRMVYLRPDGAERFYVFPGTCSDAAHGAHNALSDIRREIGDRPRVKRVGERRPRKPRKAEPAVALPNAMQAPQRKGNMGKRQKRGRLTVPDPVPRVTPRPIAYSLVAPRPTKRRLDLFDLCVWAYRDQMVDQLEGRGLYDAEREAWGGPSGGHSSSDGVAAMLRRGVLGTAIDDDSALAGLSDRVHPDALAVHRNATPIIGEFARLGDPPDWPTAQPRAWPTLADRSALPDTLRGPRDGRRTYGRLDLRQYPHAPAWRAAGGPQSPTAIADYVIVQEDVIGEIVEIPEWDERRRRMSTRREVRSVPVPSCPLSWEPSVEWVMMQQGIYRAWHRAMLALHRSLGHASLRDHIVAGFAARDF